MTEGVLASFRTRSDESILDFDRMDKFEVQKKVVEFKGLFKTLELLLELRWKLGLSDHTCVIEGLIALDDGRLKEAIQCLDSSTNACQADVDSSVQTSLLPPNLELAEKLLERGEQTAVLRHLSECHNVWQRRRPYIEEWIRIIETGGKPDFQTVGIWGDAEQPSYRLNVQWMRACSLQIN